MLGKILRANGNRNSMNGTIMKIENGIKRKISDVVVTNSLRSLLVKAFPTNSVKKNIFFTSTEKDNLHPCKQHTSGSTEQNPNGSGDVQE